MKLTKKIEAEIRKVYQAYWDSYLRGDLKTMGGFLSDDFTLIGTSDGEIFNNKKSAMKYVKATIDQVAGVLSKKNIEIKITQADDTILVNEFSDAYIKLDGTPSFYDKFRVTTVMKQVRGKWKIIHQHGSLPDSKAEVGETLATEKVKKENRELREAVKRRTRELEQKSRDLEIEASLEKVRARAMAMQSSSELADLIGMIYTELTRLDLTLDRCFIILFDEATGDATWWMASGENSSLKRGYHAPFHKNSPHLPYLTAWKNHDSSWKHVLKGAEKKKWDEFMFSRTELAQLPKVEIKNMKAVKLIYASTAFNKYGCFTVGTLEPLASASFDLLARFSSVFEQTYTRFLDLKKAEAQARESQIQLALERIRARTMAMQHSDELQEAANLLFKQVQSLEIPVWSCGYNIWEKHEKVCTGWMSTNETKQPPFRIPLTESPTFRRFYKSRKKNEDFYAEKVEGDALVAHYKYMFSLPDFAKIGEAQLKAGLTTLPEFQINHVANFAHGNLIFITGESVPDAWDIFKRFAKVFEQTYTRFLDLKKAEAQVREVQIEVALERVRSRTMAMHRSDELREVVGVLYEQLKQLGFSYGGANIALMDPDSGDMQWWMSGFGLDEFPDSYLVKYFNHPGLDEMLQRWKKGDKFASVQFAGESKKIFDQSFLFESDFRRAPEEVKLQLASLESATFSLAYMKYGALNMGAEAITSEQAEILQRFAIVFEQTYTRFLDLKKAEAQAREAQIEAALEKVRSSSMGMHHSDELEKVVSVLFDKLSELGLSFDGALIYNFDKEKRNIQLWVASKLLPAPVKVKLPHNDEIAKNPIIADLWQAIEKGDHVINRTYSGKVKDDYFLYVAKNNENNVAQFVLDLQFQSYTISFAAEKNSIVGFDSWTGQMTSDQDFQVIRRFAGVFEQAYTRFLDLQRAEAQARESQIQLALERVRARTMAMQKSDELKEVAMLLFKQVADLGITCWTTGFNVWNEDGNSYVDYVTNPMGGFMEPYTVDTTRFAVIRDVSAARKKGETFYVRLETGDRQKETYAHLNEFGDKDQYGKILESGFQFPAQQVNHFVFGSKVSLMFITYEPVPEAQDIFKRFGKAFELTFTRFLDLEKAEAQARESQIQLALERVRARTMAMQKSHELADVAELLFQQVSDLGIKTWTTGFNIWLNEDTAYEDWITNPQGGFIEPYIVDTTQFPIFIGTREAKQRGDEFLVQYVDGELIKETYKELTRIAPAQFEKLLQQGFKFPSQQYDHFVFGSKVSLMFITYEPVPEAHDIFKRFGKVFEQTYTRFLDLQNAEAQARESQIQLALERVRARTMAMQRSDELAEAAVLMFQQIKSFGLELWGCGFNIWEKDEKECMGWMSSPDGGIVPPVKIPLTEHPVFIKFYESRQKGIEFYTYERGAKELGEFYEYLVTVQEALKEYLDSGGSVPTFQIDHVVNFAHGNLIFITYEPCPDAHDIFKRFGKVFEQTYTRFLDLQNAEAQARESQIQLALERVRARTMAMQRSDELNDLAILLFQQVSQLGIKVWATGFNDWSEDNNSYIDYITSPQGSLIEAFSIDVTEYPVFVEIASARKSGVEFWVQYLEGEMLKGTHAHLRKSGNKRYEKMAEEGYEFPSHQYNHFVFGSKVSVMFNTYEPVPEAHDIFIRFGKVFEQTYTRFLDLKKAEAQAREAQIEAALERVRSRTMAMHKSEELLDVITVVSEQLQHVGIKFGTVSFGKNNSSFDMDFWVAAPDMKSPIKMYAPYTDIPIYNRLKEAYRERRTYFSDSFTAEETKIWNQHFIDHNPELFSEKSRGYLTSRPGMTRSTVLLKNVFLFLINYDFVTYSNEDIEIVIRFANVFEQTYTRFLDLQKAEAQAREAQIEAALERLRSRTMAMQRSTELAEVSQLLHQQFLSLGVQTITCAFMFPNEEKKTQSGWSVLPDGTLYPTLLDFPLLGDAVLDERYSSWKEKKALHRKVLEVDENRRHHQFLSERVASHISKDIFTQLPDQLTFTNANFAQGYLMTFTPTPLAAEEENILARFAKVFEQTYTRFLDLQKAEAQAREAQIESALEKIRSRSLAMHHSGELKDVVAIMFEKMKELNVVLGTIAIQLFDQSTMNSTFWAGNNLHDEPPRVKLPYYEKMLEEEGYMKDSWDCKQKGENIINKEYTFEQKTRFFDHVFASNDLATISEADRDVIRQSVISPPNGHIVCLINEKNSSVFADSWNGEFYSDESIKVLIRAAKVFEQAYVRFLDLQKAEAQARESQIEAALERVRSRTMAMHKSGELLDVIVVVSQQLTHLGFRFDVVSFARTSEMHDYRYWFCLENTQQAHEMHVPYLNNPMFERVKSAMSQGVKFLADTLTVSENREWVEHMLAHGAWPDITKEVKDFLLSRGYARSIVFMPQIMLFLGNYFLKPYSEEQNNILKRFAAVFEQSYTRFLDLQKAEAQAREAQIEAALERVRAKAMAMHTAQQLSEVVHELRTQMGSLGQKDLETCVIHLNDESPDFIEAWAASHLPNRSDEIQEFHVMIPKRGLKIIEESMEAYSANRKDYVMINDGARLDEWIEFMRESVPGAHALIVESIDGAGQGIGKRAYWSFADFQGGSMLMVTLAEPDETSRALLRRFSNVFGLAYRRFADLKQAEAQVREATIETALEKIRSRSLGMHKSEEILDVVAILFEKLKELGLVFDGGAAIHLFSEGSRDATIWVMSPELSRPIVSNLPYDEVVANNPIILDVWKARDTGQHIVNKHYSFDEKKEYFEYVFKHNALVLPDEVKDFIRSANSYTANFIAEKNSLLGASSWTGQEFSENDVEVLKRVARVFEQAYIRFLDLQRAEAQTREANIEAALEKIRSRSLGMHKSEEILDVVAILFEKLKELGLVFDGGAAIHLFSEGSRDATIWVTAPQQGKPVVVNLPYDEADFADNPIILDVWRARETGESIINKHYPFEQKNRYFHYVFKHNTETPSLEVQKFILDANSYTATFISEKNSLLGANSWTEQKFSDDDVEVLKRVARVFEQAYVRFLDLQKAEVHAREAICQASLDRVRAEIASMRTVEDLDRITPLIWRELNTIGIPSIRCGVFIMDEPNHIVHTFLSTPAGKAIGVFHLPFDIPGFVDSIVQHWRDKKMFLDYWDDVAKNIVAESFVKRGLFASAQQYLDILPKEEFHLHFLPFAQGMLYVGNLTKLKDEELTLLQSLADSFATAYARYDDFNKLESAKQQVDRTLVDLKQAQQQLVQSEKMASLGELTAGIAHEIQNPLNFVNNFSEVSNELIEEMKTELQAGNLKDAAELAESIKQNLEKITHHGKRADGIVKGMLQHSRAGSGQKEPTDLNFLCDEYLRLAYHGYRAKDKSFNAKFETDFDPTLPKVNVVPQDMGRVILNLINNAFYAVSSKASAKADGVYEPTVRVATKMLGDKIEIQVGDNGPGIPASIKEKIFQPFFTTKPTGQGTGLGLSLAYDIVTKLHGGELKVETKQGEGCAFVIIIPCTK